MAIKFGFDDVKVERRRLGCRIAVRAVLTAAAQAEPEKFGPILKAFEADTALPPGAPELLKSLEDSARALHADTGRRDFLNAARAFHHGQAHIREKDSQYAFDTKAA